MLSSTQECHCVVSPERTVRTQLYCRTTLSSLVANRTTSFTAALVAIPHDSAADEFESDV
jgi:hypothetical protein